MPARNTHDTKSLVERYDRLAHQEKNLFAPPAEREILEKLVWPLRQAKVSYVIGNNLAVVALCGMVAEMVAVLLWQLEETEINGKRMGEKDESALFGRAFEKLGQERRVTILKAYGIITSDIAGEFYTIRSTRNKYLHLWSEKHDHLPADAEKCFSAATRLVVESIGQDIEDGRIALNPKMVRHLKRLGVFEPSEDQAV